MCGPLVLVGMMGAGKTTVGRVLSVARAVPFDDLDALVERADGQGRACAEIISVLGMAGFRDLEREALRAWLAANGGRSAVLATGGGAVLDAGSREAMASVATVVWLDVGCDAALERMGSAPGGDRPLLDAPDPAAAWQRILEERRAVYDDVAHARVPTDGRAAVDVASEIQRRWNAE